MPPRDLTKYSSYFAMEIPGSLNQIGIILLLGMLAGETSSVLVHYGSGIDVTSVLLLGAGSGVLVVSVPALLTVFIIKVMKRRMKMKHALFAVMAVSAAYAAFMIFDSAIYSVLRNGALSYVILLLANASIYGYWFIINRIAVGQKRSAIITAEIQPILNVLLYFPFGGYLLRADVPVGVALLKLYSGMLVFLIMGYTIIYLLDRPARKKLSVSSVDIFSSMVNHWLYDMATDTKVLGKGGTRRSVQVDIAALYSNGRAKAVFVRPDIHYGPFGTVGGSIFTEAMGNRIVSKYGCSPFIIHSAVNIEDNPMSTAQVYEMSDRVCKYVDSVGRSKPKDAYGFIGFGSDDPCRAVNIRINDVNLLTLSKAPTVTEDMDREVGKGLAALAGHGRRRTMLIDAHNSRFESAGDEELKGIGKGSKYISKYERAVIKATAARKLRRLKFGSASAKISTGAYRPDLGPGYSSMGVFDFGGRAFAMLYIDANNMLPGFRSALIEHVKGRYGVDMEVCTTDTHAVNSIALSAKNVLGRYTKPAEIIPFVDQMMDRAMAETEPVRFASGSITFEGFKVWGTGSEEMLNKVGMDIIKVGKTIVPFVIVAAYVVAGWIIYII